jgi:DNA (cytosine-5)-methyltransferase 1
MKVVSLFSGAGGLDLGFKQAGHKIVWAVDNFPDAVETYRRNIGDHIIEGDIADIPSSRIPPCDIVIGGFPCQGFSVANWNRKTTDKRNLLYREMVRVVRDKQPKYFLGENVRGLLSLGNGAAFKRIVSDFASCGYRIQHAILNSADFGVPQRRERLFILGVRKDLETKIVFPPPATHSEPQKASGKRLLAWVAVGKALKALPDPDRDSSLANHTYSKYKLRFNGYIGHRRINPSLPAPTVTARGDVRGGVVVLHHPNNKRRMTARELATVQSFPLDFAFHGTRSSAYVQIGNAVPPAMAEAIARAFSKQ